VAVEEVLAAAQETLELVGLAAQAL